MPPTSRSAAAKEDANNAAASYTLALLSEYNHALDALPLELSRNFADLRELDAVLSTSMASITAKIQKLTQMIEDGQGPKEERLWLLTEIAEEAKNLKPGGEDKIRVACLAADNLKGQLGHMRALAEQVPGFDSRALIRTTTFPHVSTKQFFAATATEGGRRRRGAQSLLTTPAAAMDTPVKRKRAVKEDDGASPRKERAIDMNKARGPLARARRIERPGSPTESLLSVNSHQPTASRAGGSSSRTNGQNGNGNASRRSRTNGNTRATSPSGDPFSTNGFDHRRELLNVPPSTSHHPSLPPPFASNGHSSRGFNSRAESASAPPGSIANDDNWNPPPPRQLEGPGIPPAFDDSVSPSRADSSNGANGATNGNDNGEEQAEDERIYCFCNGGGVGEMIGCDGQACSREWFHLACLQLPVAPPGKWYCDECLATKNNRRPQRGGRRKVASSRNGGRS